MARSLNKVQLIGNLTRDPELRYTPQGTAVCTFGLATNRQWTTESGEKKEDAEFHRIVAWNKLAEICSQLLTKGRKAYIEGRLQTRTWQAQDGTQRTTTEIVASDMIILDSRREGAVPAGEGEVEIPDEIPPAEVPEEQVSSGPASAKASAVGSTESASGQTKSAGKEKKTSKEEKKDESEDIPF